MVHIIFMWIAPELDTLLNERKNTKEDGDMTGFGCME
jgi:hypothetical protein